MKLAMGEEKELHWSWVEKQQQNNSIIIFVEHHQEEHTESWQKNNTKY